MDSRAFADASRDDQLAFVKFASGCYEGEGERERESPRVEIKKAEVKMELGGKSRCFLLTGISPGSCGNLDSAPGGCGLTKVWEKGVRLRQ